MNLSGGEIKTGSSPIPCIQLYLNKSSKPIDYPDSHRTHRQKRIKHVNPVTILRNSRILLQPPFRHRRN